MPFTGANAHLDRRRRTAYGAAVMRSRSPLLVAALVLCLQSVGSSVSAAEPGAVGPAITADRAVDRSVAVIETLSDSAGPYATRARAPDGRWQSPSGDAVLIDEAWWTPLRPLVAVPRPRPDRELRRAIRARIAPAATKAGPDRLIDVSMGDVDGDGRVDLVTSHRRPFRPTFINATRPRRFWRDEHGLSAHVGVYRPDDLSEVWVAGTLLRPVARLAACDGALAVAYGRLDAPGTVSTSAWRWVVFGFLPAEPLPGPGTPICVDIDGDGRTEPAITGRSAP